MKIAIIGAGISGLVAAKELSQIAEVTVFEKSRGVGGRMSTRYATPYQFDHGAQYFSAKTDAFKDFLKPFEVQGIIEPWNAIFCKINFDKIVQTQKWSKQFPHYVAAPKMNQLCKTLAVGLNVVLQIQVKTITKLDEKWEIFDIDNKSLGIFDFVISSAPAPQTADLMPESFRYLEEIKKVKMVGCYSLMLAFKREIILEWEAAIILNSKISWISINNSKPQRPQEFCLVAHSTNAWAEENMEVDAETVQKELMAEVSKIINFNIYKNKYANLHRWKYANAEKQSGQKSLFDEKNKLAACGDWLIQGRVEAAFLSAMDLVGKIKNSITK